MNEQRSFAVEKKGDRTKFRDPRKGAKPPRERKLTHQDELEAGIGKPISISTRDDRIDGTLVACDAFTLTVDDMSDGHPQRETFFKSALVSFRFPVSI